MNQREISIGDMQLIKDLVGNVSKDQLKSVECFVTKNFGIFIPSVGYCQYATLPQHTHPSYSFVLFFSEEQSIVPVAINVKANQYLSVAMAPDVPHEEEMNGTFTRYIAIFINPELYHAIYKNYQPNQPETYFWDQFSMPQDIMHDIKRFMSEYENEMHGYQSLLDALATTIIHQIVRGLLQIHPSEDKYTDKFGIEKVIAYMHQHFGNKVQVCTLAQVANMSESHFMRTFKMEVGVSPMTFLMSVRIENAKKLIRSGDYNMTEVSMRCGFSNASHFSSAFTKHTGLTPTEYHKSFT